jgi:hypothetical protein
MMACGQSNLSASWVQQTEAMGYGLLPTFVGLQAPCNSFSGKIDPKQPHGEGGRDLPEHRRRLGGQRDRTRVTGGLPIRTGRIQFAITGPGS